jgi:glutamine amidotransferase-like uncharacterized protein
MKIAIYQDYVHNSGTVYKALTRRYGMNAVYYVDADDITNGALQDANPDIFVMPNGASRFMDAKLNGAGYAFIERYLLKGGRFLAICGGTGPAAPALWAIGTPHELRLPSQLNLYKGHSDGPIPVFASLTGKNGTNAAVVSINIGGASVDTLYMGGSMFIADEHNAFTVLATYDALKENNAAVIAGEYGQGRFL